MSLKLIINYVAVGTFKEFYDNYRLNVESQVQ